MKNRKEGGHAGRTDRDHSSRNLRSALAILLGLLIAACGFLLPNFFFSNESRLLIGSQNTVSISSSDSVQTVVRDTSFTLEDYAYITDGMQGGFEYYSEPNEAQLSMREASGAAGEILNALLPDVFTGEEDQAYTLNSAILTSNALLSDEAYDYRQSFWYVDIFYAGSVDGVTVSSTINAVNGKAWYACATFPLYDSYGYQVANDVISTYGTRPELFFNMNVSETGTAQSGLSSADLKESDTDASSEEFFGEFLTDGQVLVYHASDFFERLESAIQTFEGLDRFMESLYDNYMEYLGLSEEAGSKFSTEVYYNDNPWYREAFDDIRELLLAKEELQDMAGEAENYGLARMYGDGGDSDEILLDVYAYDESIELMALMEECMDLVTLAATDEADGLSLIIAMQILCEEELTISVSLEKAE